MIIEIDVEPEYVRDTLITAKRCINLDMTTPVAHHSLILHKLIEACNREIRERSNQA